MGKTKAEADPKSPNSDHTEQMLETAIGLLGRLVFPQQKILEIVTKRKKNPEQYVKAYNLCDGAHGVTEIAKEIGVAQPTLTPILSDWKDRGIVYEITGSGGKFYRKLYKLEEPRVGEFSKEKSEIPVRETGDKPSATEASSESPSQSIGT